MGLVGGKTASLGEMTRELAREGVRVPPGFAVTTVAYDAVLDRGDTRRRLHGALRQRCGGRRVHDGSREGFRNVVLVAGSARCGIISDAEDAEAP